MPKFGKWIEVTTRPLTEEEKEEYEDECEWYEFIYNCELPDDGQEVLITTKYGYVAMTTFYTDMGCYFEQFEDGDDVLAWMPLPEAYKKEKQEQYNAKVVTKESLEEYNTLVKNFIESEEEQERTNKILKIYNKYINYVERLKEK